MVFGSHYILLLPYISSNYVLFFIDSSLWGLPCCLVCVCFKFDLEGHWCVFIGWSHHDEYQIEPIRIPPCFHYRARWWLCSLWKSHCFWQWRVTIRIRWMCMRSWARTTYRMLLSKSLQHYIWSNVIIRISNKATQAHTICDKPHATRTTTNQQQDEHRREHQHESPPPTRTRTVSTSTASTSCLTVNVVFNSK